MKNNIGLMVALLGLASGAIYAATKFFNKTNYTVKTVKVAGKKSEIGQNKNKSKSPTKSSIGKSYTYVAEDF